MPEQAHLRIHGHGDVEVELAILYLSDLTHAYNSVLVFDMMVDGINSAARGYQGQLRLLDPYLGWPVFSRRPAAKQWPPTSSEVSLLVPRSQQLILTATQLRSPGFWEFLGQLNPLEFIRHYLNDRHERRKDREYRESAEARRLQLENALKETEVLEAKIRIARELGATDRDLAPLLNALVYHPVAALDRYQDKNVIEIADPPRVAHRPERKG